MLRVYVDALDTGPVDVSGSIASDDPLFDDIDFELAGPVRVSGRLLSASLGRFYWQGSLAAGVTATCRRCLTSTPRQIDAQIHLVFTEDQDTDDPSEYVVPEKTDVLDLSEAIREELILALEAYVLCREDCKGLCSCCGTDLNTNSCDCRSPSDPRWVALRQIKNQSKRVNDNGRSQA